MKGFTLIELIIVIVIIGILAAIAVPRFLDLADNANRANVLANTKAVLAAVNLYYANSAVAGTAQFPASLDANMFADNKIPEAFSGVYSWEYLYVNPTYAYVQNNVP